MVKFAAIELGAIFTALDVLSLLPPGRESFKAAFSLLAVALCLLLAFQKAGLLKAVTGFRRFLRRLSLSLALAAVVALVAELLFLHGWLSGRLRGASLGLGLLAVLPLRAAAGYFVCSRWPAERVILVGAGPLAERLLWEMKRQVPPRYNVLGLVDDTPNLGASLPIRRLGSTESLRRVIDELSPDRIIVTLSSRRGRLPLQPLLEARAAGIAVENGVEAYERLAGKLAIEDLTPSSLIFCQELCKGKRAPARVVSLFGACLGLLVSAPLLALISLAILLDSPGPVLFLQDRIGLRGRRFRLIKFRTMHPSSRVQSEWEKDNGDRITRVGRWLRRFRLDELPQFLNVLRGDMNLVGPRPHPLSNLELFCKKIPYYRLRSSVHPGITGWAQIRYGYANNLEEETEKMRYDLFYIKHRSFALDARILLETVRTVLLGRGANDARRCDARLSHPEMAA
jgi:exopolysaccharide biosynthesis polyprenyl glycosylphosphotransferase